MKIRTMTKKDASAGEIVCTVDILDGETSVISTGISIRGGAGLAPNDSRSLREHMTYAAHEAVRNLESKAKIARQAVLEFIHGREAV
jgi:hypothetical protein